MSTFDLVLLFSPQNCSLELLEANLTSKRRELADSVVARIKDAAKQRAGRYDLLIGPRGTGKTHVLAYIEQVLRRDVGDGLLIVHLSEEEFGIGTMLDFLVACLQAARVPLDPLYDDLRGPKALEIAEKAFLAYLNTSPSLLIVENFALVLDAMDTGEQRRLRTFLQSNPQISVLASSPWLFGGSDKPDHPFHGFFLIEPLDSLTRVQARDYLIQLAGWKGDEDLVNELRTETAQARVNAIHDLTGGNHRLLGMLSECLRADDLQTLVEPFVRLVDRELTPYYQQRLGRLAAQPYKILRALARQQGATPVKEIARLCYITEQTTSGQLRVLKDAGLVRSEQRGRESWYELQEPLMRFVLDIKEGREKILPSMVALLREWYDIEELRELAQRSDGLSRAYLEMAYDEKLMLIAERRPVSAARRPSASITGIETNNPALSTGVPEELTRWFQEALKLGNDDYKHELELYDRIENNFGGHVELPIQATVAEALVEKGAKLGELGSFLEALAVFDKVVARFGRRNEAALLVPVGRALINKGTALGYTGDHEAAIEVFEEAIVRFEARTEIEFSEVTARAIFGKGVALDELGRYEQALEMYDEVERRFGDRWEAQLLAQVAKATLNRGAALANLGQYQESLASFDEVERRFGLQTGLDLRLQVVRALFNKGVTLVALCEREAALVLFGATAKRFESEIDPRIREFVFKSQMNRCVLLQKMDRGKEAAEAYLAIDFAAFARIYEPSPELLATCLDGCRHTERALRHLVECWPKSEYVVPGLTHWVQSIMPMSATKAKELTESEMNLRRVFIGLKAAAPVLDLFSEARAYSLGDSKALLRLPLEARRLVERAYGIATEE